LITDPACHCCSAGMLHQLDATKSSTAWVSNGCYCWNIALYEPDAISDQSTAALINRQGL